LKNYDRQLLLVGDNPFHGISHLSQDRARMRDDKINQTDYATNLVLTSLENGANGFMFSVSETTLSILKKVSDNRVDNPPDLYAIVPYAYEYVRTATHLGTVGLAKTIGKQIFLSKNLKAIFTGLKGLLTFNPETIMKTYLYYEISRITASAGKRANLKSILLHEVITDMIIALDLKKIVLSYVDFLSKLEISPGFETRNFPYLVHKLREWNIDFSKITITTAFNKVGFIMNPSQKECEDTLEEIPECNVIAMSPLAAGYIKLPEAVDYIQSLPNIKGVVAGVSKEKHATETFKLLKERLEQNGFK
jgi:hypothetical protein